MYIMEQKKQRCLYADCASGIAGDMFSAALIDIIEDRAEAEGALRRALSTLNIDGWKLSIYRDKRGGIGGTRFEVVHTDEQPHRHLSDIEIIIQAADLSDRVKEMSLEAFHMLAEAEAKAISLIEEQLTKSPNYIEYYTLQKWNGVLPQVMSGDVSPFVVLDKDSAAAASAATAPTAAVTE